MSNRKLVIVAVLLVALVAGWYAFRPERIFVNQQVNEQFPTASAATMAEPAALAAGQFHSVAHDTKGSATVYQLAGGKRTLRLTDFQTSNGPDVRVYLVAATDAGDNETVTRAGFLEVGALKGNVGDQNYDVPADVDLAKYKAVTIWCKRFGVNFGTAPLGSPQQQMGANAAQPAPLAYGNFHDVSHKGSGTATIYRLADGKRVLRFTNFETSNGPDVVVYLVAAADATDADTVKNASPILLGSLKGNVGDQNYDVPADADLSKYKAVTIWCRRFSANFATAPLAVKGA
ncbi:MAG TPA: DM13 domain-containing protein [Pyrinomonadaceae bacterium]|nr:DM13 domain-containing protein [Pyrinomonadaceae bacterium]